MKTKLLILTIIISSIAYSGGDHGETGASIGPDKGILEASERKGIKISPEALKNFEIKTIKLKGDGPWSIPKSAILYSGEEINLFRLRDGFFKRIDFQKTHNLVDSDDMRENDEIVISGLGFLRTAELAAFGGAEHGHSH